jgi:hypothetical protein
MSNSRIFCFGAAAGMFLLSFLVNRDLATIMGDRYASLIAIGFVFGCTAVAVFGDRK